MLTAQAAKGLSLVGGILWQFHIDTVVMILIIVALFLKTPAAVWIRCLVLRRPLALIITRDNFVSMKCAKRKSENLEVKGLGFYELQPDGVYNFIGGLRGGLYVSDKVPSLAPYFLKSIMRLAGKGFENYRAADLAAGMVKGDVDKKSSELMKDEDARAIIAAGLDKEMEDGMTYLNFATVRNFFKYSMTPSGMLKVIDYEKATLMDKFNKGFQINMNHAIIFFMILIGGAIAFMIISNAMNNNAAQAAYAAAKITTTTLPHTGGSIV